MMRLIALLAACAPLWAASCSSNANGNWSAAGTWTSCGGGVPGNGDTASISHAVVIDQDIGSSGGGGIKNIQILGASAALTVDGAAQRTIWFGSTGTNPVGSGSATAPGADATMFGFLVDRGTLSFSNATATNYVRITTANGTSPFFIRHIWGGGGVNQVANLTLRYTKLERLGTNTNNFRGIDWQDVTGDSAIDVQNCWFVGSYAALHIDSVPNGTFSSNVLTGEQWNTIYVYEFSKQASGWTIQDNTSSAPAGPGHLLRLVHGSSNTVMRRNAVAGASGIDRGLWFYSGTDSTSNVVEENFVLNNSAAESGDETNAIYSANIATLQRNVIMNADNAVRVADPTGSMTVADNIFLAVSSDSDGQGQLIEPYGTIAFSGNIVAFDSAPTVTDFATGLLCYQSTASAANITVSRSTFRMPVTANRSQSVVIGEATHPCTSAVVKDNNVQGGLNGIYDQESTNGWVSDYASVGAHHNNVYGATNGWPTDGPSPNFGTGHPNTSYGDLAIDPAMVDWQRRPAGFSAYAGGVGTESDLMAEFGKRSGMTGTASGHYTVARLYNWVRAGFAPRNLRLANTASDASYIGAVKPIAIGAAIP